MSVPRRSLVGPVTLCLVLCVTLVIGSGAFDSTSSGAAARITALERDVRCPDCITLSVAQSNTEPSIALRDEIVNSVRAGKSDDQILATITRRYGTSILLLPPPGGIDNLLWIVPTALALGAGVLATRILITRRRVP